MIDGLIEKFRDKYPTKRITYLNEKNAEYGGEYLAFNLEILKEILQKTTLNYEIKADGVYINGDFELFSRLLFECALLACLDKKGGQIILYPYTSANEIMRISCAVLKIFEKSA